MGANARVSAHHRTACATRPGRDILTSRPAQIDPFGHRRRPIPAQARRSFEGVGAATGATAAGPTAAAATPASTAAPAAARQNSEQDTLALSIHGPRASPGAVLVGYLALGGRGVLGVTRSSKCLAGAVTILQQFQWLIL